MRTLAQTTREVLDLAAKHFQPARGNRWRRETISFKKLGIDSLQDAGDALAPRKPFSASSCPITKVQGVSDFKTLAERIQSRL